MGKLVGEMGHQLLTLKTLLISAGVLFMALGLRFSVPLVMEFLDSHIPVVFGSVRSWLRPPYLYIMINFIIISIAASSRFHKDHIQNSIDNLQTQPVPPLHDCKEKDAATYSFNPPPTVAVQVQSELLAIKYQHHTTEEDEDNALEQELVKYVVGEDDDVCDMEVAGSGYLPPAEKHVVSAKLGHQKPMKIREDGKARRDERPTNHETMENTWKAIMEKNHNNKSFNNHVTWHDTWENHVTLSPIERRVMNETEKFKDRTNQAAWTPSSLSPSSSKLRKESSLSQDELNRRAEEFIKKINEDMRLQRKESWEQYMNMINRGT